MFHNLSGRVISENVNVKKARPVRNNFLKNCIEGCEKLYTVLFVCA